MSASLFPSTSIGRTQGANIARTPSRETLAVHPLLSADPSAKYVPYTPRQRTTAPPIVKPQLASLRTAAQTVGLDAHSVGWAILDKIAYEGDTSDDWSEIWNALTKTKAALLLPSEPASSDLITLEFVQDHVVLCDLATRDDTAVVTLSGLRGHLVHNTLTFRSSLHRSTTPFQSLLTPLVSRAAALDALPPLPVYPPESSYPSIQVQAFSPALPLPTRATKPHLPPRPGMRAPTPSSARLAMPFASLFGQRPSTPPPPMPVAPPSTTTDTDPIIDIAAFITSTSLSRTDIATGILGTLQGELAVALNDHPPWLVERVHAFAAPWLPFVKVPAGKKKLQDIGGHGNRVLYAVNGVNKPEDMADRFQVFYRAVESELRNGRRDLNESEPVEEKADDANIRDTLETIESTLCTLLYDRLFLPSTSDDASHNEALSSRIAALNMLDLGLEHLDIAIGDTNRAEVDVVVQACGEALTRLDTSTRSPREKAAVMVTSHKRVVEGLSKIPPIRLKSPDEDKEDPTRQSNAAEAVNPSDHAPQTSDSTKTQSPLVPAIHLSTSPDQLSPLKRPPNPEPALQPSSSPVSGDVLLPILIFSVVKANPSRFVSHLLFTQRFRNQSFGGEESYCLINLMAVAEFLENVDLTALGLGANKVLSTADLTPIPITRPTGGSVPDSPIAAAALPGAVSEEHLASLRGRVGQGVDAIAGSANKVILGVVDSSFGVLRALLPGQTTGAVPAGVFGSATVGSGSETRGEVGTSASTGVGDTDIALWGRPGLGLLRRETGFSIAGLTGAFPSGPGKGKMHVQNQEEQGQRELVEVSSRPASLRSRQSAHSSESEQGSEEEESGEEEDGDRDDEAERGAEEDGEGELEDEVHDARSIKSFESMLSSGRVKRKMGAPTPLPGSASTTGRRKRLSDLTDRLTHGMAGMSRRATDAAHGRGPTTTFAGRVPPPNRRFVECTEQDIRVSEVGELLREYQRLVEAVRAVGGFQE